MFKLFSLSLLAAATVLAGPPLICDSFETGGAKSLPWRNVNGWDGTDPAYRTSQLVDDTMRILTPTAPLNLRMETLRRAAIYAARDARLGSSLSARLMERMTDHPNDAWAFFDGGFFVEAVRQTAFIYRYEMLSPAERETWVQRGERLGRDGLPWLDKARQLGMKGLDGVYARIEAYRLADLKHHGAR
ncbi:MAG: hypothetical protein FJW30_03285 [Acidobacteria bacterium]|nr:hypothetical protein [Acidobacteriota bacterium]